MVIVKQCSFVEGLLAGDDTLIKDMVSSIDEVVENMNSSVFSNVEPPAAMVAAWRIGLARYVNPF